MTNGLPISATTNLPDDNVELKDAEAEPVITVSKD